MGNKDSKSEEKIYRKKKVPISDSPPMIIKQLQKAVNVYKNAQQLKEMQEKIKQQKYYLQYQRLKLEQRASDWQSAIDKINQHELHSLFLGECKIYNSNLQTLTRKKWKNLAILYLNKNNITALGMVKLVSMPWTTLKFFNVSENNIGNQGAKLLTKAAMPMMERLHLNDCKLGNDGVQHLAKGEWKILEQLHINDNKITIDGYTAVSEGAWQHLNWLGISSRYQQRGNYNDAICVLAMASGKLAIIEMFIKILNNQMTTDIIKILGAYKKMGFGE